MCLSPLLAHSLSVAESNSRWSLVSFQPYFLSLPTDHHLALKVKLVGGKNGYFLILQNIDALKIFLY